MIGQYSRPERLLWLSPVSALLALAAGLLFTGCSTEQGSASRTAPEDLLVAEAAFPVGWKASAEGPHPPSGQAPLGGGLGPIDSTILFFYIPVDGGSGGAYEEILLFRSQREASEAFDKRVQTAFHPSEMRQWETPQGIEFRLSNSATNSRLSCTVGRLDTICRMVAQYDSYVVDLQVDLKAFNSDLEAVPVLSTKQLERILQVIDQKLSDATR